MTTTQNPVADLTAYVQRGQAATADVFEAWADIAAAMTQATGSQAKNLRQIVHGLFDLVDQGFTVEREIATYLTIAYRVAATAADSARELTDITLASVETAARAAGQAA